MQSWVHVTSPAPNVHRSGPESFTERTPNRPRGQCERLTERSASDYPKLTQTPSRRGWGPSRNSPLFFGLLRSVLYPVFHGTPPPTLPRRTPSVPSLSLLAGPHDFTLGRVDE